MTITDAVQGHRDLDTMEMAIVFRVILPASHINEDYSELETVMIDRKLCGY